jgi:hypothetical protein
MWRQRVSNYLPGLATKVKKTEWSINSGWIFPGGNKRLMIRKVSVWMTYGVANAFVSSIFTPCNVFSASGKISQLSHVPVSKV